MVIAPARRAGDPGSIPGPGGNFSLKLLIYDLSEGYSIAKISSKNLLNKVMPHKCFPPSRIDGTSAPRRVMGI